MFRFVGSQSAGDRAQDDPLPAGSNCMLGGALGFGPEPAGLPADSLQRNSNLLQRNSNLLQRNSNITVIEIQQLQLALNAEWL